MKKILNILICATTLTVPLYAKSDNGSILAGGEYNYWHPISLDAVNVKTTGYNVAFIELNLKKRDKINSIPILPNIPRLRYENI